MSGTSARAWLPLGALLLVLGTVFLVGGERGYFYRPWSPDWQSVQTLTLVENFSPARLFLFKRAYRTQDGGVAYDTYNRYPPGAIVLLKLALLPFEGDLRTQIHVAELLMLALFCGAAVLAYLAVARITRHAGVALTATLLVFSSSYMLGYSDVVATEMSVALFAAMLVFHGMVLLRDEGRYWQLPAKVCVALLLDWHAYALLAPFLALGLAHALAGAWRQSARLGGTRRARLLGAAVGRWLRGRECLLGVIALLFGTGVLGYNLLIERTAFADGQTAFVDLPSAHSVSRRLGFDETHSTALAQFLKWRVFLQWQLHRIGGMSLPYVLPGHPDLFWTEWQDASSAAPLAWVGAAAIALCVVALLFIRRHRRAMAALAAFGFCWAVPVRHNAAELHHDYESLFYLGVPLAVHTAALLFVARRWGGRAVAGLAVGAALIFVFSNVQMRTVRLDAAGSAREKAVMAEFQTIRRHVRGKDVLLALPKDWLRRSFPMPAKLRYYLAGSVLQYPNAPSAHPPDMVLSVTRAPSRALLTPAHEHVFLYDSPRALEEIAAARRSAYLALAAAAPAARAEFDIHLRDGAVVLAKSPCPPADARGRYFAHFFPVDPDVLPTPRRRTGFAGYAFWFGEHGVTFDGKCLASVPLPNYPVAKVRVGGWAFTGEVAWQTLFGTGEDVRALRRARAAALAAEPAAHGHFTVFWTGRDLTYLRTGCSAADQQPRFLVHVVPIDRGDLPAASRRRGFANRDFDFEARGAVVDGTCVASARLPDWPIEQVYTGQYSSARDVLWEVELAPGRALRR